jgi:hypothetical protein
MGIASTLPSYVPSVACGRALAGARAWRPVTPIYFRDDQGGHIGEAGLGLGDRTKLPAAAALLG